VGVPLKYAVVERERRFLVDHIPDGVVSTRQIIDRMWRERVFGFGK